MAARFQGDGGLDAGGGETKDDQSAADEAGGDEAVFAVAAQHRRRMGIREAETAGGGVCGGLSGEEIDEDLLREGHGGQSEGRA